MYTQHVVDEKYKVCFTFMFKIGFCTAAVSMLLYLINAMSLVINLLSIITNKIIIIPQKNNYTGIIKKIILIIIIVVIEFIDI